MPVPLLIVGAPVGVSFFALGDGGIGKGVCLSRFQWLVLFLLKDVVNVVFVVAVPLFSSLSLSLLLCTFVPPCTVSIVFCTLSIPLPPLLVILLEPDNKL